MVLGSVGITLLSTAAVTSAVIIAIEATALTAGIIRVAGSQANKRLLKKVEKHEKIKVLVESTLSTISGYVSKALNGMCASSYCKIHARCIIIGGCLQRHCRPVCFVYPTVTRCTCVGWLRSP